MSSDKKKQNVPQEGNEVNKHETPDSTTKEHVTFYEGEDVLVTESDGRFYLGTIVKLCPTSEKCLVKFDDETECWSFFKDLTRLSVTEKCSVPCAVCKRSQGKKNNEIVICEKCGYGYHQKCYQPVIESVKVNWKCKHCRRNKNCQLSATKKTVYEDLSYDNTTANNASDPQLPELPPTPPSSVSAPETPQPSIVNGEPPVSPTEDSCIDFSDTSTSNQISHDSSRCLSLDDLFSENRDQRKSQITLPLQLNPVITEPIVRPTKRRLSEKDIRINRNGEIKRRRIRRQSCIANLKAVCDATSRPSTSKIYYPPTSRVGGSGSTPVKTVPNGSSADLKTVVYSYFSDENKLAAEKKFDKFVAGEEYRICGKRTTLDGRVQYLIDWVKCTNPL